MYPADCPAFEYEDHPSATGILSETNKELLEEIRSKQINARLVTPDTRPVHLRLFRDLCPPGFEYYAGHYRGELKRCLKDYRVMVRADPRVGSSPEKVSGQMAELAVAIRAGLASLDTFFNGPGVSRGEKVLSAVAFACRVFVQFLTIHPYANGNGHVARFCLVAILARYGIFLTGWSVDPRPEPPYGELITHYRDGHVELLEAVVLRNCVVV
jgi:fido (protein-threonine AMPylation protein)